MLQWELFQLFFIITTCVVNKYVAFEWINQYCFDCLFEFWTDWTIVSRNLFQFELIGPLGWVNNLELFVIPVGNAFVFVQFDD